jgi:hypothetical protein
MDKTAQYRVAYPVPHGEHISEPQRKPVFRLKIPAPKTVNWLKSFGSWENFCRAARKSIGRDLGGGVVTFSGGLSEDRKKAAT